MPSAESPASLVPSGWLADADVPAALASADGNLRKLGPSPVIIGPAHTINRSTTLHFPVLTDDVRHGVLQHASD